MGRPPIGKVAMTATERSHRFRAKQHAPQPATKGATKPQPDHRDDEIVRLKAHIAELESTPKSETAAKPAEHDAELVRKLEQERDEALKERDAGLTAYWKIRTYLELRSEGVFTRKEFNKLRSFFHPDKAQGEAEQKRHAEAFEIFSRCEKLLKKEPLPPPPPLPSTLEGLMEGRLQVLKANRARGQKGAATRARKKPGRQLS